MLNSKKISKGAKADMLIGARPWAMWTRTAILTQIKRLLPREDFELAKRLNMETLKKSISPVIFSNRKWRDGIVLSHYAFSPYRFYTATGRSDLATQYTQSHSGREYDAVEACKANKPWNHQGHI